MINLSVRTVRQLVILLTGVTTVVGTGAYLSWASQHWASGHASLWLLTAITTCLFAVLFGWIAFSFFVAMFGWLRLIAHGNTAQTESQMVADHSWKTTDEDWSHSTAILMPIYNESPDRVLAGIEAMILSLRSASSLERFDFFVLSDSTQPDVWLEEEAKWQQLCQRHPDAAIHYRHRSDNKARKAGNIADFCERWGDQYELMVVLDADSLMTAETLVKMVDRMQADSMIGILQAPPRPLGRHSLFARIQQFAATVYGPVFVEGFSAWTGDYGNYWGHNAIIRVEAFRDHCDLPRLAGRKPLGGEILSHDFVEAALMVQNGWKVQLATDLNGSYEECPTTITDYAIRDQRWCQGNMQHAKLLVSEGFHPFSRVHFASGVLSYAASPIWVLFTALSILSIVWSRVVTGDVESPFSVVTPSAVPIGLFLISMGMLLLPKFFALHIATKTSTTTGRGKLLASTLLEIVASIFLSPIMAIYHSRFVLSTFAGLTVRWNAQQRDECGVSWREAVHQFWPQTLLGVIAGGGLWILSPGLFAWFSPLLAGLWLAIPIAVAMGSAKIGTRLREYGLLTFDDENRPPTVVTDRDACLAEMKAGGNDQRDWFHDVICDPELFVLHTGIQAATQSNIRLETRQTKAIEAAMSAGGVQRIPVEMRSSLLADSETLQALHLEVQTAGL